MCLPGKFNRFRNYANGTDTNCTSLLCSVDHYVFSNRCLPCAPGMTNAQGDKASGPNTECAVVTCGTDEYVEGNACVPCPTGTTNQAGDEATLRGTECDSITCANGESVQGHACVVCPAGKFNDGGEDAGGPNTACAVQLPTTSSPAPGESPSPIEDSSTSAADIGSSSTLNMMKVSPHSPVSSDSVKLAKESLSTATRVFPKERSGLIVGVLLISFLAIVLK